MAEPITTPTPNPEPTPEPTPAPSPSWRESLAEDLRGEKSLEKFQDLDSLAKSYVELERMRGNSIQLPTDTAKPEEWARIYDKLGRPSKPEEYKIERPKVMPEGVQWNEELEKDFRKFAHAQGWNQSQTQNTINKWHETITKMVEGAQYTVERGKADLLASLGTEKADQVIKACNVAVTEFGDDEFANFLDSTGFGNHPAVIKFLARMGNLVSETQAPSGSPTSGGIGVEEAKAEIARIRSDRSHPYHQGEKSALDKMAELYTIAYGNKVVASVNG